MQGFDVKLNLNQVLNGITVILLTGLIVQFQQMREDISASVVERTSLKEDIIELKDEVRELRAIIYAAILPGEKDNEKRR